LLPLKSAKKCNILAAYGFHYCLSDQKYFIFVRFFFCVLSFEGENQWCGVVSTPSLVFLGLAALTLEIPETPPLLPTAARVLKEWIE